MSPLMLVLSRALAQEPVPEPETTEPSEELVIWGRLAVDRARDNIVHQMEALGYQVARKSDGRILFRGNGKVTLTPSGELVFGASLPKLATPPPENYTKDSRYQSMEPGPMTTGAGMTVALPGGAKVQTVRDQILEATRDEIEAYMAVSRRTIFEEALQLLPERLDRLWSEGAPLDPNDPPLPTQASRRQAVLEHWATRTETIEGRRTCEALEHWLDAVVQPSNDPITDEERARYEARRADGRTLP